MTSICYSWGVGKLWYEKNGNENEMRAKEFHIGLKFLKNRYRDLGLTRWPHRKLINLQILKSLNIA
ncbi:hypothetical protein H5410_026948 [Solanum commersonii]|uniref:RWP-RK domain-containing protein n=1 Tax=Solanum commersonii TaxID=4109 RepID=A0A9J5Z0D3_SOLCO|nr:hypothetical protein H5410_026948 [Solanum commersonii]